MLLIVDGSVSPEETYPIGAVLPEPLYFTLKENREPWLIITRPILRSMGIYNNKFSIIQDKIVNAAEGCPCQPDCLNVWVFN